MSLSSKLFICVQKQDIPGVICELNDPNTKVDRGGARQKFSYQETPLQLAVESDSKKIVELLINAGANVNVTSATGRWTPLHVVASRGVSCDMMRMLIAGGADIEAQDVHGETPLFNAYGNGVELLLVEGANIDAVNHGGITPLMSAASTGEVKVVEILLAHHAVVDAKDLRGETALKHAVVAGDWQIVEILLAHKADVNARDKRGFTSLMHLAHNYGTFRYRHHVGMQMAIAMMLLKFGADIFATALGQTALTLSVRPSDHNLENFLRLEMDRHKFTAFAMASDERLGKGSQAAKLSAQEILEMVWKLSHDKGYADTC